MTSQGFWPWPHSKAPLAIEVRHSDWFREPHASQLNILETVRDGRAASRYSPYLQWANLGGF